MRRYFVAANTWIIAAVFAVSVLLSPAHADVVIECDSTQEVTLGAHLSADHDGDLLVSDGQSEPPDHVAEHCTSHACISALDLVVSTDMHDMDHDLGRYVMSEGPFAFLYAAEGFLRPPRG